MSRKVLSVLSEFGYWGIELVGPLKKLENAGYSVEFMTLHGKKAEALPPSYDPSYIDPPLGISVTSKEVAEEVIAFENENRQRLHNPQNMSEKIPERPYFSAKGQKQENGEHDGFLREFERYFKRVKIAQDELTNEYAALLLVGGSGPIIDMGNRQRVHDIILGFYNNNMPIGAICYGVVPLVFARDFNDRLPIIRGKHITGHCLEYDYLDGTGFLNTDLNMGPAPYCLEYMLRDAVGPEGQFHGNFGKETSVIVDYPFVTARSLQCSNEFGEKLVEVLDNGLKRYGW